MIVHLLSAVLLFSTAAQAPSEDPVTAESLRAWLTAANVFDSNARLIHVQMQQQRASLPPWWPADVYAEEEEAIQKVDFVESALPFYQACFTEPEVSLLTKLTLSRAGRQVSRSALEAHSQAAEQGASPMSAQTAGEDAAHRTASTVGRDEKQSLAASMTPAGRALAAKDFTPAKAATIRQCANTAFARTIEVVKPRQQAALNAVIEASRPRILQARTQWEKDHPEKVE